jgi:phosphatidylglycerophosphatase C
MVRRRRDRIKVIATRAAVRGRPVAEVDIVAHRFADEVWNRHMRSDTVDRLRWHLGRGHRVVLVSASYRNYLEPLADHLGAHAVISTELEVVNGVCTGELRGPNCRAAVKASRLRGWIDEQGWSAVEIHAYGDSAGDREMLADARRATWVGASPIGAEPNTSDEETPS